MKPRFSINHVITEGLTRIERARGFLEAARLSDSWLRQMSQRALLLEAHHSTHIEGTRLTLAQAELLFAGQNVPLADDDDVRELLNYREAFDFVAGYLSSGAPITEGLIREIHKRLVTGVRGNRAQPGQYRLVQNYVVSATTGDIIYTPPAPGDVPALMRDLVRWLNDPGQIHPVLASGIAQFQLVHIHPFVDGNGRTSRLLSTLYLYRAGYDFKRLFTISEYYDRDRAAFYAALQSVRDSDMDLTGWITYYISGLATQLDEVQQKGKQAIKIDILVQENNLNERQASALSRIMQNGAITIQEFEAFFPDVTRRTLQRDLKAMVDKRIIMAEGATHRLLYRFPAAH